jgi:hypothetical protein
MEALQFVALAFELSAIIAKTTHQVFIYTSISTAVVALLIA